MATDIRGFLSQQILGTGKTDDRQIIGIAGFDALVRVRQSYTKKATAPTTPLEDGSFANDHIILDPLTLSIEGEVCDVHLKSNPAIEAYKKNLQKAGIVTKYLPSRTATQLTKINGLVTDAANTIQKMNSIVEDGTELFNSFGNNSTEKTNQEKFLDRLDALYNGKQVFKIEMPFRVFNDMAITSLQIDYDNTTENTTKFKLSAQQLRFAKIIYSKVEENYKNPSSGLDGQTVGKVSKGLNKPIEKSFLSSLLE